GLPFFALSANAPLIQFWYARSGGPSASDPYFLYGASNLGSLTALLGFPLLAAPFLGAASIGLGWACGFVALGGFLLASGLQARESAAVERPARARHVASDRPGAADFAWWALLAFVPSSLMLAVTSKVSLDVGAVPLVWVVPLSLYLLSFVVTFSNRAWPKLPHAETGMTVVLVVMLVLLGGTSGKHLSWLSVGVLIAGFFLVALHAHRKLYEARPESAHLTAFYLTMSVGGALGGLFNSIIGPVLFSGLYEGVATLLVARLLMLGIRERLPQVPGALVRGAAVAGLAAVPALAGWAVLEIEAVAVLLALLAVLWLGRRWPVPAA
ncbi:MAG TPA: transporter, partial [Paracoccaceae bacterium]|nr:transporter [Paracoccaceae bacterium]